MKVGSILTMIGVVAVVATLATGLFVYMSSNQLSTSTLVRAVLTTSTSLQTVASRTTSSFLTQTSAISSPNGTATFPSSSETLTSTASTTCMSLHTTSISLSTTTVPITIATTSNTTSNVVVGQVLNHTISSNSIKIDYVRAIIQTSYNNSTEYVVFQVGYENVGSSAVYTILGCGSSLTTTIVGGDNSVIHKVSGMVRCLCAEAPSAMDPGQNRTSVDPGCWNGYGFELSGHGTISMGFTLSWYGGQNFSNPTSTSFTALFNF